MWRWTEKPAVQGTLIAVLAAVVVLLGYLQVRWADQAARDDEQRMRRRIAASASFARRDINVALARLAGAAGVRGEIRRDSAEAIAIRIQNWIAASDHSPLLRDLYMVPALGELASPWQLDITNREFVEVDWTPALRDVAASPARPLGRSETLRRIAWRLDTDRGFLARATLPANIRDLSAGGPAGWIVMTLDREYLIDGLIRQAVEQYFEQGSQPEFRVIIQRPDGDATLYASGGEVLSQQDSPDFEFPLLWSGDEVFERTRSLAPRQPRGEVDRLRRNPERGPRRGSRPARGRPPEPPGGRGRFPTILTPWEPGQQWILTVSHRDGSVQQAIATRRTRNILFGFGVLAVLAGAMALVVLSSRRAARLARLQLDFVAGISHELRTPLAVIRSAGENLADGVVSSQDSVEEYGRLIRDEGRRLSRMVEKTLQFSGSERGFPKLELRSVDLKALFDSLASQLDTLPRAEGAKLTHFAVEGLSARADANLLRQCLVNLVENALKYSRNERRVHLTAGPAEDQIDWIRITVEDHGRGIAPADLPHVFEAFYRGADARDAQIEGSGLGLKITKDAVEAMGGRISVKSKLGVGSVFTMDLPAAEGTANPVRQPVLGKA